MKKLLLLFAMSMLISCTQSKSVIENAPVKPDSTIYYKSQCDSLTTLAFHYEKYLVSYENQLRDKRDSIQFLNDSIVKLNYRPLMTKAQFLELYKYERLLKYYNICKNKPTQWKYYKGWSTRVFEQ